MHIHKWLVRVILPLVFAMPLRSQNRGDIAKREQYTFGTEEVPGEPLVKRPVAIANTVLQSLKEDVDVKGCLSFNPLPAGHSLTSLFIGSEIHLDGPSKSDLVVVPVPDYGCFQGATGIGVFWIYRRTEKGYELALKAAGNGLSILRSRHNGYRDIQTGTIGQAGKEFTTVDFRFDGKHYQQLREITRDQH